MKACGNKADATLICSVLLGFKQIIVVVNKMDLADFSEKRFREIESGISRISCAARIGSAGFHSGIGQAGRKRRAKEQPANGMVCRADGAGCAWINWKRRKLQSICRCAFACRMSIASTNAASLPVALKPEDCRVGDSLVFSPANKSSVVATIEGWNAAPTEEAHRRETRLGSRCANKFLSSAAMSRRIEDDTPIETNRFHADLFWMAKEPLQLGAPVHLQLATQEREMPGRCHRGDHGFVDARTATDDDAKSAATKLAA